MNKHFELITPTQTIQKSSLDYANCECEKEGDLLKGEKKPSFVSLFNELGLLNERGLPRLNLARFYFRNGIDLDVLVNLYRYWRDYSEYGLIRASWFEDYQIKHKWIAVKCSKRGNDVYQRRVRQRLGWMDRLPKKLLNLTFFSDKDVENGSAYTSMVFFTLTYDSKRCSRVEAWENIGREYDNWIRGLRSRFGKISVFRTWQAFKNGYPHIHGILLFHEKKFKIAFVQVDEFNGKIYKIYRIAEKEEFAKGWHSFVDVCGVSNLKGALKYAKRYITKKNDDPDPDQSTLDKFIRAMQYGGGYNDLDMALMWLFRKRSFAVSGDFRNALNDLIRNLHNSEKGFECQVNLFGGLVVSQVWFEWVGVFTKSELGIRVDSWVVVFEDPPLICCAT